MALLNTRAHRSFATVPYIQFGALSWLATYTPGAFDAIPHHWLHERSMGQYVQNGSFSAEDLESYIGWLRDPEGVRWFRHFYRHYRVEPRPELTTGAQRLVVPTAIIWGDRDPCFPMEIPEDLARRIPGAHLTRIAGADHYVVEERPAEVLAALEDLLRSPAP